MPRSWRSSLRPPCAPRVSRRSPPPPTYVAAVAERLPFASDGFDIAWLSTVLHQFDDPDVAVSELRRVLRTSGRVLVRGLFADVQVTGFLARFPGVDRATRRFPSTGEATQWFTAVGFTDPAITDVVEPWSFELEAWVARVRELRHVDSALRPLTDAEVEAGIAAVLEEHGGSAGPVVSETTLRLLVLTA